MDLDSVSDELYAAKREEFTALRDERAKQARPDRQLGRKIAELRKPTVAAWLVNQVSRACPEEIDRLGTVGESMRAAHQRLAGAELRALSKQRHEVIELLTKRTQWLARKAGYPFSDATQRQVTDTFEAALGDERALEAIRAARLNTALAPGSPEMWLTAATVPAKSAAPGKAPRRRSPERAPEDTRPGAKKTRRTASAGEKTRRDTGGAAAKARREADKARRDAQDAAAKARQEADEAAREQESAEQTLAEVEESLADAEQAAEDAAATVRDLQARLEDARTAEREARAEVTSARRSVTAARRAAKTAQERATRADDRATDAENHLTGLD